MGRRDHDVLFGVLSVQLGLVEPTEVTAISETAHTGDLTLAERLEADGRISSGQRRALENIVVGTLASEPDGLEDTLIRFGADDSFLEETFGSESAPPGEPVRDSGDDRVTTEEPGRYALSTEVGRGGLGLVRSSFDRHLGREVAVKELLTVGTRTAAGTPVSGTSGEMVTRFVREARVTAQMDHPNIVPVYELGRRPDGTLYYTMRLVRGRTLKNAIHDTHDLVERLALLSHFVDLCQAIAYAHSRGVIHRDIKPDNVMIGEFGETQVLDWGVAKVRGKDDIRGRELVRSIELMQESSTTETLPGAAFGTPAYMSPEQATGNVEAIDERSDVWSLGVVLYQLLTGKLPITGVNLASVLVNVARGETPEVKTVCPAAPPELAAVAQRALAADPSDRYQSAKELAQEIEAYHSGAKVSAYEYSSVELVRRFLERNRPAVFVSMVALVMLAVLGVGAYLGVLDERDRALVAERSSRMNLADAYVEKARVLSAKKSWVGVTLESAAALALVEHPGARGLLVDADGRFRPRIRWRARTFAGCLSLAGVETSDEIACGTSFGIQLLSRKDGEASGRVELKGGWVTSLAVSPSGAWLVAGDDDGRLTLVSRVSRTIVARQTAHLGAIRDVAFSPDGRFVLSAGADGAVRRYGAADLQIEGVAYARDVGITAIAVSSKSKDIVVGDADGNVTFRGEQTTTVLAHDGAVHAVAWSPGGRLVASAGRDRGLLLWDARSRIWLSRIPRGVERISTLAFVDGGRWLIAGNEDGEVERYDLATVELGARAIVHDGYVRAALVIGDTMYSAGDDKAVRSFVVEPEAGARAQRVDFEDEGRRLAFVANGEGLAVVAGPSAIVWDLPARRRRNIIGVRVEGPVAFSSDAARIATAEDTTVTVRGFTEDHETVVRRISGGVDSLALSADGRWLAVGATDGYVRLFSLDGEAEEEVVRAHDGSVDALAFTADGSHVVSAGFDGAVRLLPVGKGAEPIKVTRHEDAATRVAAAAEVIASTGGDGKIRIYDLKTARVTAEMSGHDGRVRAVALDGSGSVAASGGDDRMLVLWDVAKGEAIARIRDAHATAIVDVTMSEGVLASLSEDGVVRVWSLADLSSDRRRLLDAASATFGVRFDGMRLVPDTRSGS